MSLRTDVSVPVVAQSRMATNTTTGGRVVLKPITMPLRIKLPR